MEGLRVAVDLAAVVLTVRGDTPEVLLVERDGRPALPSGELSVLGDRTLDRAVRRWVREETGLSLGFVEQLYTFGDLDRDRVAQASGVRRLTVAYVAFVRHTGSVRGWRSLYEFFPWEDRRSQPPSEELVAALGGWVAAAPGAGERAEREERVATTFGGGDAPWDPVRALERYELAFSAGLVDEARRDGPPVGAAGEGLSVALVGEPAHLDDRRMLAAALGRVRGKLTYRPVVFELLPEEFTLSQLQHVVEALGGASLHKQNFRRLVEAGRLVEPTGEHTSGTAGRPAALFRFRREVLRERPAPGVGLPRPR